MNYARLHLPIHIKLHSQGPVLISPAKASDEFQRDLIFSREHKKQKHQFYPISDTLKVMFLFCVFSIKDQISLKLVRWAN